MPFNRGHLGLPRHAATRTPPPDPEEVVASQRGRLLLGMADAVAEKGYVRTSVAEVLMYAAGRPPRTAGSTSSSGGWISSLPTLREPILALIRSMLDRSEPVSPGRS
jgi:hypothetical protein